ncbi:uncharacterized protein LOC117334652 [Pecten maximus]|uniref:uncharacterized protein LOC117334652 n=1 Tax=Pecten maximus TaxID=6579 RepID=UPI001458FAA3|nr:uncharacterized protein LOC117334652 [Pecten maximus]XP_033750285.1 uncharacterized protein LOC117334652 [Pecten maximus]XP_033750287.1 uncharacterized protein LOC117334652 [Pecten maximus]XP_033750288.1 uncharacterized protein LOC117334652 [Pecten maximus]XP_033750289.1 uncharacterized protein LOC117334652 [Pecten maximus]XP_033750290.1 uncharacterized protein LOC117334652 [Pecten maximus]
MSGQRRLDNDHEKAVIRYKLKQQRTLEKSMQTLQLEKDYSIKLLNLDHRIVKVNYKRLKEKVSRIKSNLNADEISTLKDLDSKGKLKSYSNTVNLSSALKIAAAAKRLKLQGQPQRAVSVYPFPITAVDSKNGTPRPDTVPPKLGRSNSVTGAFIDAPEPVFQKRRNSIDGGRPSSAVNAVANENTLKRARPQTASRPSAQTPRSPTATTMPSHSLYSSHTAVEKDLRVQTAPAPTACFSDDSIDSNLGEDLYEERRQEMLLEEELRYKSLQERKDDFMVRLNEYIAANPSPDWSNAMAHFDFPDSTAEREEELEDEEEDTHSIRPKPRKRLLPGRSRLNMATSFSNEEVYKQKMLELWQDLNKCRYLRLPDERIDISGVDTLAKRQVKLYQMIKDRDGQAVA